jgi:hypothetical protein
LSPHSTFVGFPESTQRFYQPLLFMLMLNIQSYKRGLFDVLLCETDDVYSFVRFIEDLPRQMKFNGY